jgi:cytoskeletal protein CcmA (bactofilin family)
MGATYTRQSTYSDGDVITAAHTNDEFNQLLAAFAASTGHTHDGTTAEGGPITKLLGTSLTFGDGTAGTDISITFDGETNDGVLKWMEDEDYFEFSDDILVASTEKIQFGDTATFLQQSSDGVLRIDGEATIDLNASTAVTVSNDLKLDSDSAVLGFGADNDVTLTHVADTGLLLNSSRQLQFGDSGTYIHQSAEGVLDLVSDTEIEINATTIDINGAVDVSGNLTVGGNIVIGSADISEAELEVLDGLTVTTAEVNILDGDTSATSTTVADADRVVLNDNGTMKQVAVTDLSAYFDDEITAMPNLVSTGALDSGSITSGFGNIDTGSSTITTTGAITGGSLVVDNFTLNGTELDLSSGDFTLDVAGDITLDADGADVFFADGGTIFGKITNSSSNLEIKSTVQDKDIQFKGDDGGSEITALTLDMSEAGAATFNSTVTATGFIIGSANINENDLESIDDITAGTISASKAAVVDTNKDITGFRNITLTGELDAGSLDVSGDADIDGTLEADAITVNGTALNTVIAGVTVANATTAAVATTVTISDNESTNEDNAIIFTSGGDVDGGNIGLESDGDLTYNPSTGRLTATQLSGTLQTAAQGNVTSLGTLTTLTVDNVIINGSTIGHTGDTDLMTVASGVLTVAGEVDATSLDISGDADIDGTLEADAITVNGTALNTVIGNEATALAIALG